MSQKEEEKKPASPSGEIADDQRKSVSGALGGYGLGGKDPNAPPPTGKPGSGRGQ